MAAVRIDSELALPVLVCEDLPEDGATVFAGNWLRLRGWAVGATSPLEVAVDIDGEPVPVATLTGAPTGSVSRQGTRDGERVSFRVELDTSGWTRGRRMIRIIARDGASEASRSGTLDLLPHDRTPTPLGAMLAVLEAGGIVLVCDEPTLNGTYQARNRLAVRGWAHSRAGVKAVTVSLDGRWRRQAEVGYERPDLVQYVDPDARFAGFELLIDLEDVPEGEHWLAVVAVGRDGQATGMEGSVQTMPAIRPEASWVNAGGRRDAPEHFVPEEGRGHLIEAEHQARYRLAARIARDAEVLDVACGVGYGAAILARGGARRVVGLDRNPQVVLDARERVGEVAEFVLGDLRRLPFDDASWDVVTCFDVIEHAVDTEAVLEELHRVLRPDGVLLISTRNRAGFSPDNPDHAHEFLPNELRSALEGRFANVRLRRQQAHLASFLSGDEAFEAEDGEDALVAEIRKLSTAPSEVFTVAVASDASLPELGDVLMLGGVFDLREFFDAAWLLEERAIAAEADAAASRTERAVAYLHRDRIQRLLWESEEARGELQAQLDELKNSKSWQMTAPLRRVTDAARRQRFR